MNPELLLSDKFVEFSQKVAALHESKKKVSADLKNLIEEHKNMLKKIDQEAILLQNEFDSWMQAQQVRKPS